MFILSNSPDQTLLSLCSTCISKITLMSELENICIYCHDSWIHNGVCKNCNNQKPIWNKLHTIFPYSGPLKQLFFQYKFNDSMLAEKDLVNLLTPHLNQFSDCHFVIIPCNKNTKRRLGHHPVTRIIKQITNNYSEPFINNTHNSMKSLDRKTRQQNPSKFIFKPELLPQQHNLLLIDDVFTTGTTLAKCSQLLIDHQINDFNALCFFRS